MKKFTLESSFHIELSDQDQSQDVIFTIFDWFIIKTITLKFFFAWIFEICVEIKIRRTKFLKKIYQKKCYENSLSKILKRCVLL